MTSASSLADRPSNAGVDEVGRDAEQERRGLRLALAGGGTGGHMVPGLHLLAHDEARAALGDLIWFQTGRAVEARVLSGLEQQLAPAKVERVALELEPEGGGAPSLARLSRKSLPQVLAARRALLAHRTQVVLGLGGFTSLPVVAAARLLGLPVALLEINAACGRATRWLSPLATRVLHAWRATVPASPGTRDRWIGPPLSPEFLAGEPDEAATRAARKSLGFDPDAALLLVLGGSQGALGLNRFVAEQAGFLLSNGVQVLHQVGPGRSREAGPARAGYRAVEYVTDVPCALRAATLVLCRGGASTLAELAALRRPAWIVPYPHHADEHQEKNARELGAGARIFPESNLDSGSARELVRLVSQGGSGERRAMSAALAGVVPLDGAGQLLRELLALAQPALHP
jgi:UDP-N-acetylglucosamine:LPS N-acetylglucosamine transferase